MKKTTSLIQKCCIIKTIFLFDRKKIFWNILYFSIHFKQSWDKACPPGTLAAQQHCSAAILEHRHSRHTCHPVTQPAILDNQSISQNYHL